MPPDDITNEPQYQEALSGVRAMLTGGGQRPQAAPDAQDEWADSIKEMLVRSSLEEMTPKKKRPPFGMFLIPGYAEGYAQRQELERRNALVDLEKQRQKGAAADRQLRMRAYLAEIGHRREARAARKLVGSALSQLQQGGLDEQAQAEFRGQVQRGLVESGDPRTAIDYGGQALDQEALQEVQRLEEQSRTAAPAEATDAPPLATEAGLRAYGQSEQRRRQQLAVPPGTVTGPDPALTPTLAAATPRQTAIQRHIVAEARRQGVDPQLALAVAAQESGFDPAAVSPRGAQGVMQLMPGTARELGVDPTDLAQNIRGGVTYLKQQLAAFGGDQQQALAAYNAGPDAVRTHGGVPPFKETRGYVQKILGRLRGGTAEAATPAAGLAGGDRVRLAGLRQERARLEALLPKLARLAHTRGGKASYDRNAADLGRVTSEIGRLEALEYERSPEKQHREVEVAQQTGMAATTGRLEAEQQQRQRLSAQEVLKDDVERFYDVSTGARVNPTIRYADLEDAQRGGDVTRLPQAQAERLETIREALPIVATVSDYVQQIYGPGGVLSQIALSGAKRVPANWALFVAQYGQHYPVLEAASRYIDSNAELLARGLKGVRGAGTEGDVQRAKDGLPRFEAALGVQLWPPKLSPEGVDRPEVAVKVLDDLTHTLNTTTGKILGNTDFAWPELVRQPLSQTPSDTPLPAPDPSVRPPAPGALGRSRLPSTRSLGR